VIEDAVSTDLVSTHLPLKKHDSFDHSELESVQKARRVLEVAFVLLQRVLLVFVVLPQSRRLECSTYCL